MPTICYELGNYYLILTNIVFNVHVALIYIDSLLTSSERIGNPTKLPGGETLDKLSICTMQLHVLWDLYFIVHTFRLLFNHF